MKRRVFTQQELVSMSTFEYRCFVLTVEARAFRLLGINWSKFCVTYRDVATGDFIVEYE